MSRGPWKEHGAHCPKCGHYARQVGSRPKKRKRYQCANDACRHPFVLTPGELAPGQPAPRQKQQQGPYAIASPIRHGRGAVWGARIV